MMKKIAVFCKLSILAFVVLTLSSFTIVSDEEMLLMGVSEEQLDYLKEDVVLGQTGIIDFPICHSQLNVPSGFQYLDEQQSKKLLLDYWNNSESHLTKLLGILVPSTASCYYQIPIAYVLTYDNSGYIRDDDANSIDYGELLWQMQERAKEENKSLPDNQRCIIKGWAVPPRYDNFYHTLIWAQLLDFDGNETVNYDMRILGKDGFVSINAVIDPESIEEVVSKESEIIQSLSFYTGYTYFDFDPSRDKVSDWTIGGLVAGGILAKTGVLAKIGAFLLKFSKLILLGIVAIAAGIIKWFRSRKEDNQIWKE